MQDLGFSQELIGELGEKMVYNAYWKELDRGSCDEEDAREHFKKELPQYAREIDLFWDHMPDLVREYDYAAPLVQKLRGEGYRVYLLSNYPRKMAKLHWSTFRFVKEVDGMVISAEEHLIKPDVRIYQVLLDRYGLDPSECIFLDDVAENVEGAKQAGMEGIVFTDYEHSIGELRDALTRL
jgi:putative hydrolase of the HAD superfamily